MCATQVCLWFGTRNPCVCQCSAGVEEQLRTEHQQPVDNEQQRLGDKGDWSKEGCPGYVPTGAHRCAHSHGPGLCRCSVPSVRCSPMKPSTGARKSCGRGSTAASRSLRLPSPPPAQCLQTGAAAHCQRLPHSAASARSVLHVAHIVHTACGAAQATLGHRHRPGPGPRPGSKRFPRCQSLVLDTFDGCPLLGLL